MSKTYQGLSTDELREAWQALQDEIDHHEAEVVDPEPGYDPQIERDYARELRLRQEAIEAEIKQRGELLV